MSNLTIAGVTYRVDGYIRNKASQPVNDVTISIVVLATGEQLTVPFKLEGTNNYEAYTEHSPAAVGVKFVASGYQTRIISFQELLQNANVLLQPGIQTWQILAVIAAVALYRKRAAKVGALSTGDILPIFLIVGGIIGFTVIKKILEALGLWDDKDTKDLDDAAMDPNSFWNPNYWQTIKPASASWTYAITQSTAEQWCREIYNSFGAFNDDEETAIGVFKRCRTKANASFLVYVFDQLYNQDLLTFLRGGSWPQDRLSDGDVNTINRYISSLPKY